MEEENEEEEENIEEEIREEEDRDEEDWEVDWGKEEERAGEEEKGRCKARMASCMASRMSACWPDPNVLKISPLHPLTFSVCTFYLHARREQCFFLSAESQGILSFASTPAWIRAKYGK